MSCQRFYVLAWLEPLIEHWALLLYIWEISPNAPVFLYRADKTQQKFTAKGLG